VKIFTTFHPQKYAQSKVVNKTLVQLLRDYNKKNPNTWDENLIYIQRYYNRVVHNSTSKSPFETFFRYFPLSPLDVRYGKQEGEREDIIGDASKAKKIVNKIRRIHLQV
jgi:hypothetical protein